MSYTLHIWVQPDDEPVPQTASDAAQLIARLDSEPRPCPQFRKLAALLTASFPCICSPEAQDIPESRWAWSDGPLDGETDTAVYGIGLNRTRVHYIKPSVIAKANALMLNVFDEQTGEIFIAPPPLAPGERLVWVRREFVDTMQEILAEHGFTLNLDVGLYERRYPGGLDHFWIPQEERFDKKYPFSLTVMKRLDRINETIARICGPDHTTMPHFRTIYADIRYFLDRPNHTYPVRTNREMDAAMRIMEIVVRTKIMPFLERLGSVEAYEQFINADTTTHEQFPVKAETGLTAACLVNPGAFEKLAAQYERELTDLKTDAKVMNKLRRLVVGLRAELA